jgi:hypothetical protein
MFAFPEPRYMPCNDCGESLADAQRESHVCDPERQLNFAFVQLLEERELFEEQLTAYLESPRGRFDVWYSARRR